MNPSLEERILATRFVVEGGATAMGIRSTSHGVGVAFGGIASQQKSVGYYKQDDETKSNFSSWFGVFVQ